MTLVAQVLNFLVFYFVLRRFFLAPVVAIIEHDDQVEQNLKATVELRLEALAAKKHEVATRWQEFQASCKESLPITSLPEIDAPAHVPLVRYPELSYAQVRDLATKIAHDSLAKVKHVKW